MKHAAANQQRFYSEGSVEGWQVVVGLPLALSYPLQACHGCSCDMLKKPRHQQWPCPSATDIKTVQLVAIATSGLGSRPQRHTSCDGSPLRPSTPVSYHLHVTTSFQLAGMRHMPMPRNMNSQEDTIFGAQKKLMQPRPALSPQLKRGGGREP